MRPMGVFGVCPAWAQHAAPRYNQLAAEYLQLIELLSSHVNVVCMVRDSSKMKRVPNQ